MPTKKIKDLEPEIICLDPEHNPPAHMVYSPGVYEHVCPRCHRKIEFTIYPKHNRSIRQDETSIRQDETRKAPFFKSLVDLTGCDGGCILFPDGVTKIGNWSAKYRNFEARRTKTPRESILAIKEHVLQSTSNPDHVPKKGWKSWKVGEIVITIW